MTFDEKLRKLEILPELYIDKETALITSSKQSKEQVGKFKLSEKSISDIKKLVEESLPKEREGMDTLCDDFRN